jgi:predicted exporter
LNAVILSALITTVASYAVVFTSTIRNLLLLAVIGFIAAAIITITLQKVSKRDDSEI